MRAAPPRLWIFAELSRPALRLIAVAPQLPGKEADRMVAILISEDAQPAKTGKTTSDRLSRRLFDRLVTSYGQNSP
ncbi:DUF1403 family protein [Rhizobium tubonense]|uniref:DUF1403 family protein n=1 Tax=Rhizobium tubonense TaxID=484088 RepID=UPI001FCE70BA|nr:DUF1403 family protein [Rhizobium tubonense]